MALQGFGASRDASQNLRMVTCTQPQQGTMPASHILTGYSTIDNTQIQPAVSLSMVQTLVQAPQTITSSQGYNMPTVAVPASSTSVGMQPVGHVMMRSRKEEMGQREQERRIRREIANCNERRRMQSINSGFKSLKSILPHTDGEKLSKAAILQQTSEYITQLESDKLKLMHQTEKLRRAFTDCKCNATKNRVLADIFEKDEGIGSPAEEDFEDLRRGLIDVRQQLDKERRMRIMSEDQVRTLESQLYPERAQSMKLSSSDERRSSSECSPSATNPIMALPMTKAQPCVRPLLPPLAPLFSKLDKPDGGLPPLSQEKPLNVMPAFTMQTSTSNPASRVVEIKQESTRERSNTKFSSNSSPQTEQLVTVFSHSTRSNQPLKKRAIEIHHQSLSDSGNDGGSQPPKRKVAKITIDQPPDIGTRSFLPLTLPPVPTELSNRPFMVHNFSTPLFTKPSASSPGLNNLESPLSSVSSIFPPSVQLLNTKGRTLPISSAAIPQETEVLGSQHVPFRHSTTIASDARMFLSTVSHGNTLNNPTSVVEALVRPPAQMSTPIQEHVLAIDGRRPSQDSGLDNSTTGMSPVYVALNGISPQGANVAYLQSDGNKIIQLAPAPYTQPHFVVTPVSNPGTVFVTGATPNHLLSMPPKDSRPFLAQQPVFQHWNTGAKIPSTYITYRTTIPPRISTPTPVLQQSLPHADPTQIAYAQTQDTQAFLQTSTFPKFQNPVQKIQNPQTVLCYTQPEITLNQLNAVPTLAPLRSLHHPGMLPVTSSILQPSGSDSPSYMSPALRDNGMQSKSRGYLNPATLSCRKSSLSATDSCGSVSGAEDDEGPAKNPLLYDPDSRSAESVPTIKLSSGSLPVVAGSPTKLPSRNINVAAYDEISQDYASTPEKLRLPLGVDVADCRTPPARDRTVSVLSTVVGSPQVVRHIDAIQTRRNLETIVQAIDHLEQEERRNSQDRPEVSDDNSH